jgi:transcriptional regulator GlxA family with amidase domain
VRLLGEAREHRSLAGLTIPMHGNIADASSADVVIFASGPATRQKYCDKNYLGQFNLDPSKQMIGSMCSGALILGGLGLLGGKEATTYPTARTLLSKLGAIVVNRPFVQVGNIATAASCLAGVHLCSWIIEERASKDQRDLVMASVEPIGSPNMISAL